MKVTVRFTLDVPDGTDPQKVLEEAQKSIDSEIGHGGLCQWGDWDVGEAELAGVELLRPSPGITRPEAC
jgi:hypothetical protein